MTGGAVAGDKNNIEDRWGSPSSLLPPNNPTILDLSQEMADADRYPLTFGDVIRAKDPNVCPESILPFLAWERSTDLWDSTWDITKKRYVSDVAFAMQRKKGTASGIRWYVRVEGGEVLNIYAPPMIAFPGAPMTDAQRLLWLEQFPQLRSYPYSTYGYSQYQLYTTTLKVVALSGSGDGTLPGTPAGAAQSVEGFYPAPDQACLLDIDMSPYLGNKTFLYQPDGSNTPVDVYTVPVQGADGKFTDYEQAVLPTDLQDVLFLDNWQLDVTTNLPIQYNNLSTWFLTSLDLVAVNTVTTLSNFVDYGSDQLVFTSAPIMPGLTPIETTPMIVFQIGLIKMADTYLDNFPIDRSTGNVFMANGKPGYFLTESYAGFYIYTVLYLYNPAQQSAPLKMPIDSQCFLNYSYFQFPSYTARVVVEIFSNLPQSAMLVWFTGGYLINPDMTFYYNMLNAVRAAKSARDLVWVDTQTYSVAVPDLTLLCGTIKCGQPIPILNA